MRGATSDSFLSSLLVSGGCVAALLLLLQVASSLQEPEAMLASLWAAVSLLLLLGLFLRRSEGHPTGGSSPPSHEVEQARLWLEARLATLEADDPLRDEVALALEHLELVAAPRLAASRDHLEAEAHVLESRRLHAHLGALLDTAREQRLRAVSDRSGRDLEQRWQVMRDVLASSAVPGPRR